MAKKLLQPGNNRNQFGQGLAGIYACPASGSGSAQADSAVAHLLTRDEARRMPDRLGKRSTCMEPEGRIVDGRHRRPVRSDGAGFYFAAMQLGGEAIG